MQSSCGTEGERDGVHEWDGVECAGGWDGVSGDGGRRRSEVARGSSLEGGRAKRVAAGMLRGGGWRLRVTRSSLVGPLLTGPGNQRFQHRMHGNSRLPVVAPCHLHMYESACCVVTGPRHRPIAAPAYSRLPVVWHGSESFKPFNAT